MDCYKNLLVKIRLSEISHFKKEFVSSANFHLPLVYHVNFLAGYLYYISWLSDYFLDGMTVLFNELS